MKRLRAPRFHNPYDVPGRWWKVGIHMHTTNSDGHKPVRHVIATYKKMGFHAIAITDHDYVTRVPGHRGLPLLIPGSEVSGPVAPDFLYLGARETGKTLKYGARRLQAAIRAVLRRGGVAVVAHPAWSGLGEADLAGLQGHAGIEIYNHVAWDLNGRGTSVELWDRLLERGQRVWGFAGDDAHFDLSGLRGAPGHVWLWVKAPRLTAADILRAMRRGAFHASRGPRIHDVTALSGRLVVRTSPALRVHLGSAGYGAGGAKHWRENGNRTRWTFDIMKERLNVTTYVRVEVVDDSGRIAYSNPLFVRGRGIRFW